MAKSSWMHPLAIHLPATVANMYLAQALGVKDGAWTPACGACFVAQQSDDGQAKQLFDCGRFAPWQQTN